MHNTRLWSGLLAVGLPAWGLLACTNSGGALPAVAGSGASSNPSTEYGGEGPIEYTAAPTDYRESTLEFRHSMVALAPEWEPGDYSLLGPLGAEIVAWGNDPVFQGMTSGPWKNAQRGYSQLGVKQIALNVFALSATAKELAGHPELQDAAVVDIAGERIVPPWQTETHEGVPTYWGCTNHPTFLAHLEHRLELCSDPPGQLLHIDDHLGTAGSLKHGGCFCEHCLAGFRAWLSSNATAEDREVIGDLESFDYGEFLRQRGYKTRAEVKEALEAHSLPLGDRFWHFQRDAARTFVHHLRSRAESHWERSVPVGVNAWNTEPSALFDAHLVDYFANELTHIGKEDVQPPFSYLLGTALDRPLFATASGEDWVEVMQKEYVERVQGWIAQSYAFGHAFMYAYRKWAFSEETGTLWYDTPLATFTPVTDFVHENADLLDGVEPVPSVAVLYDAAREEAGGTSTQTIVEALHDHHVPVALVIAGNDSLLKQLTPSDLEPYQMVIVADELSESVSATERAALDALDTDGRLHQWKDIETFLAAHPAPVRAPEDVWVLPRRPTSSDGPLVLHVLNRQYDDKTDHFTKREDVTVQVEAEWSHVGTQVTATWAAPGQEPQSLEVEENEGWVSVTVPQVNYWGILTLR